MAKSSKARTKKRETVTKRAGSPRKTNGKSAKATKRAIAQYDHRDKKRVNIPPVGLVTPETDPIEALMPSPPARKYEYDPHLDPQLQWADKAERLSFDVPTVSLHVHERIDPKTIIESVRVKNGNGNGQMPLFASPEENPPLRDAVDFYKHKHNWTNRLIAGDSLLVMNSLLEKEGLGGQVQMVYIDPPYGIRYGSNFQPFVNKRDVKDGKDEDLTQEPEMLKAFRDTWELGIHSYLTYLRDRLLLTKELLHESGSCFVQISDENIHHVREMLDEVFGAENFVALIPFRKKTMPLGTLFLEQMADFLLWYAKQKLTPDGRPRAKYRGLTRKANVEGEFHHCWFERTDGSRHRMSKQQIDNHALLPPDASVYRLKSLEPSGPMERGMFDYEFEGHIYPHPKNGYGTGPEGMDKLKAARRLQPEGNRLTFIMYADESSAASLTAPWYDTIGADDKMFVVQTNTEVVKRCLLMTTDPGDMVLDPTCGSGTTAYVAEQWGRRWITTDTSRVAITLAKQRLMTATFDYYTLAHPEQGVGSGFKYKTVPHVTLKSIANNPEIKEGMTRDQIDRAIKKYAETETLYDQPEQDKEDKKKARVTGPFTVEAVPAAVFGQPEVRRIDPIEWEDQKALPGIHDGETLQPDSSIARSGETLRQSEWRTELLRTGIRAKAGERIEFVRMECFPGRWLHGDGETKEAKPRRVVVSFGPEFAPLEQRQVAAALEEAYSLVPKPALVVFAALQFDPEASKDIDETKWPGVTMLKAQMNGDLVTDDLKKARSSNESFWLIGQPDIRAKQIAKGDEKGKWQVEVHGFDYYNPKSGKVESGGTSQIALWMLDTDYDGRSVYARQVFFPMSGPKDGWTRLAKNLKVEIDQELIEQYRGTESLPFEKGKHGRVAVKIVDDRGIESLRILELK
jgi:adenine-specific DNA-methyltransferase